MLWSKLQKQLYNIIDPTVKFQMHCSVFKERSNWNVKPGKKVEWVPRFWITINKETIWDFPVMFLNEKSLVNSWWNVTEEDPNTINNTYGCSDNYTWVSDVIRAYIDTPKSDLLTVEFEKDNFGLVNILRKYDRRISKAKRTNM